MTNVITKAFTNYLKRNVFGDCKAGTRNANPSQAQQKTWAEFGHVASVSKQIRTAFWNISRNVSDRTMVARLSKQLFNIIREDKLSPRGCRNICDGNMSLLEGFQFNANANINRIFRVRHHCTIDRKRGHLFIDIFPFNPPNSVNMPPNVTHFKLLSAGAELNFRDNTCISDDQQTGLIPIHNKSVRSIRLKHVVTPGTQHPLLLALCIEPWFADGTECRSWDCRFNAGGIVKVFGEQ